MGHTSPFRQPRQYLNPTVWELTTDTAIMGKVEGLVQAEGDLT